MVTSVIQLSTHLTLALPCVTFCRTFSLHRTRSQFSHVPHRFQQPHQFLPWGCTSMSGRCYWHLVPRGQECCPSCSVPDSPPRMPLSAWPCLRLQAPSPQLSQHHTLVDRSTQDSSSLTQTVLSLDIIPQFFFLCLD